MGRRSSSADTIKQDSERFLVLQYFLTRSFSLEGMLPQIDTCLSLSGILCLPIWILVYDGVNC